MTVNLNEVCELLEDMGRPFHPVMHSFDQESLRILRCAAQAMTGHGASPYLPAVGHGVPIPSRPRHRGPFYKLTGSSPGLRAVASRFRGPGMRVKSGRRGA